jgi:hypothetical protein
MLFLTFRPAICDINYYAARLHQQQDSEGPAELVISTRSAASPHPSQPRRNLFHLLDHNPPALVVAHVFVLLATGIVLVEAARGVARVDAFIFHQEDTRHAEPG